MVDVRRPVQGPLVPGHAWLLWGCRGSGSHVHPCMLRAQSCPPLCNSMNCSLPGSSVHGIFQQDYWSGLSFSTPRGLPNPGIEPGSLVSSALAGRFLPTAPPGSVSSLVYSPSAGYQYVISKLENHEKIIICPQIVQESFVVLNCFLIFSSNFYKYFWSFCLQLLTA